MIRKAGPQRLLLVFLFLTVWEVTTQFSDVSPILVAPPSIVIWTLLKIVTGFSTVPDFYPNLWITVRELAAAYTIVVVVGLFVGAAVGSSKLLGDAYMPVLLVLFAIPSIILYPIIFLLMGTEMMPKIVFGVMVGIFRVIFNTTAGLRQVDQIYVTLAQSVGLPRVQTFFKVILPAAAPTILGGLKLGFGYTIIGVIVGELLVVNAGMGFLIDWASFQYFTPELYALILLTMSMGVAGSIVFVRIERMFIR